MGTDFLERVQKTIKRSWDRQRVALGTSDLFTRQPEGADRTCVGEIIDGARLTPGEKLTVEKDGNALVARRGLSEVIRVNQPSADLVRGIDESCGIGIGTVDQVYGDAGVAEISIC